MTSFGTCWLCASEVEPLRSDRRTLGSSSIFTWAGRVARNRIWTCLKMSRKRVSRSPFVAFFTRAFFRYRVKQRTSEVTTECSLEPRLQQPVHPPPALLYPRSTLSTSDISDPQPEPSSATTFHKPPFPGLLTPNPIPPFPTFFSPRSTLNTSDISDSQPDISSTTTFPSIEPEPW